jgi:transcriptional regulator with XRE-family HTH domain
MERGMTQEELAERADVHITWIGRVETGRVNPTLSTVVAVARALGVRTSDLIALAEEPVEPRGSSPGLEAEIGWRNHESSDGTD